jgi:hypothetical protein
VKKYLLHRQKKKERRRKLVQAYNPSTQEAEVGGWSVHGQYELHNKFSGQPGLHNETLSQIRIQNKK